MTAATELSIARSWVKELALWLDEAQMRTGRKALPARRGDGLAGMILSPRTVRLLQEGEAGADRLGEARAFRRFRSRWLGSARIACLYRLNVRLVAWRPASDLVVSPRSASWSCRSDRVVSGSPTRGFSVGPSRYRRAVLRVEVIELG